MTGMSVYLYKIGKLHCPRSTLLKTQPYNGNIECIGHSN